MCGRYLGISVPFCPASAAVGAFMKVQALQSGAKDIHKARNIPDSYEEKIGFGVLPVSALIRHTLSSSYALAARFCRSALVSWSASAWVRL